MSTSVRALELSGFDSLPRHARRCVFWEVDPRDDDVLDTPDAELSMSSTGASDIGTLTGGGAGCESEFDKEAWMSEVLLEWGTCCQVVVEPVNHSVVGSAFYAPPRKVPRARRFPSAPVSADAVLLTRINMQPGFEGDIAVLLDAVITDVARRGVHAIEAFGLTSYDEPLASDLVSLLLGGGDRANVCERCIISTDFLLDSGFEIVAHDRYLPRLRLELDEGLGWKIQVERALEKLVEAATVELAGSVPSGAVPAGTP